jgi:hypothetical protein
MPGALLMPIGPLSYGRVLPFERMFEFMFEFELVLIFELDMFVFDIGVDIGVEIGVDIGVARFVLTRFALLAVLFDVASPQAIPRAARDNIAVSAIFFIRIIDLPSSQSWKYNGY